MQVFAFAEFGRLKADLGVENKAFLQAIYVSAGSVRIDVKWRDGAVYELDKETEDMTERVQVHRKIAKSSSSLTPKHTLADMAAGNKLPCAQVYVRASWFTQVKNLRNEISQAVKRGGKAAIEESKAAALR